MINCNRFSVLLSFLFACTLPGSLSGLRGCKSSWELHGPLRKSMLNKNSSPKLSVPFAGSVFRVTNARAANAD
jgi:hypothetical protein